MEEKIKQILEEKINPALSQHYGQAVFTSLQNGVAYVKLTGACGSCPSSADTFESVVKKTIMEDCPEVEDVVLDTSVSEDLLDFARKILNKEMK